MSSIASGVIKGDAINAEFGSAIQQQTSRADQFRQRAEQARLVGERREAKFQRESDIFFGNQVSSFAKAGVDISGTPLLKLGIEKQLADQQRQFLRLDSEFQQRQLLQGVETAEAQARSLRRGRKNALLGNFIDTSQNLLSEAFTLGAGGG